MTGPNMMGIQTMRSCQIEWSVIIIIKIKIKDSKEYSNVFSTHGA